MITGWRWNNRLPFVVVLSHFLAKRRLDSRQLSPKSSKLVALSNCGSPNDDLGQYSANCEVAGTLYAYKKCAGAECRPMEPFTAMYAEGEGGAWAILQIWLLFLR